MQSTRLHFGLISGEASSLIGQGHSYDFILLVIRLQLLQKISNLQKAYYLNSYSIAKKLIESDLATRV